MSAGSRMRLGAAMAVATVIAGGATGAQASRPGGLRPGVYAGNVSDPDGEPDVYAARIRITTSRLRRHHRGGTVRYSAAADDTTFAPSLACKGKLRFLKRRGARFYFHERISGGSASECLSGGTVVLRRRRSSVLTYKWSKPGVKRAAPTGRLTRSA